MNASGKRFEVVALTANSNHALLAEQANEFRYARLTRRPEVCHIFNNGDALRDSLKHKCEVWTGRERLLDLCQNADYDVLVMAISGCDGIEPTLAAAKSGKRLALANKESVVSAGSLLKRVVRESGGTVVPVDSEHNAIFQCLDSRAPGAPSAGAVCSLPEHVLGRVRHLVLTTSGGPFRGLRFADYRGLRMRDNVAHPVWRMGSKITVDSATMMNKALEVLEAHHLFGVPVDRIRVLVHKECVVHSLVEFVDSSVLAQLYLPDMRLPLAHALCWPDRAENALPPLDLTRHALTFAEPDLESFPFLGLAFEVGRRGGLYPAALNAANDMANALFRKDLIDYGQLHRLVRAALDQFDPAGLRDDAIEVLAANPQDILSVDSWAKARVGELYSSTCA